MLTIPGREYRFCDGITRRDALKIGALAMGGLSLPDLLRAEAEAGIQQSHKAIIMIYMVGAPAHQDMYDLKIDAPVEIRGEFRPIATNVSGIQICEHMPGMAAIMDKCVPLRSVYGSPNGAHDSFIMLHGSYDTESAGWKLALGWFDGVEIERTGEKGGTSIHRPGAQHRTFTIRIAGPARFSRCWSCGVPPIGPAHARDVKKGCVRDRIFISGCPSRESSNSNANFSGPFSSRPVTGHREVCRGEAGAGRYN